MEHDEAGVPAQWLLERTDHVRVLYLASAAILTERAPVDGHGVFANQSLFHQLVHHRGHATGVVVVLPEVGARRLQVHQQRHLIAVRLPIVERELHAQVACDGSQVNRSVGRSADRGVDDDRVQERVTGHYLGRPQILVDHRDDALSGLVGNLLPLTIGGRNRRGAG